MSYLKSLGPQNALLLTLTVLVCAVTGLNSYVTRQSTAYFFDASTYEAQRLANIQVTHVAQVEASKSSYIAAVQTQRLQVVEGERDEARETAICFYQQAQQTGEALNIVGAYCVKLENLLKANKIAAPPRPSLGGGETKPGSTAPAAPKPAGDRTTNLDSGLHNPASSS
jgi:hypothetical protein